MLDKYRWNTHTHRHWDTSRLYQHFTLYIFYLKTTIVVTGSILIKVALRIAATVRCSSCYDLLFSNDWRLLICKVLCHKILDIQIQLVPLITISRSFTKHIHSLRCRLPYTHLIFSRLNQCLQHLVPFPRSSAAPVTLAMTMCT